MHKLDAFYFHNSTQTLHYFNNQSKIGGIFSMILLLLSIYLVVFNMEDEVLVFNYSKVKSNLISSQFKTETELENTLVLKIENIKTSSNYYNTPSDFSNYTSLNIELVSNEEYTQLNSLLSKKYSDLGIVKIIHRQAQVN